MLLAIAALAMAACGPAARGRPPAEPEAGAGPSVYAVLERAPVPTSLEEALDTLQHRLPRETIEMLYASETDVTIELQETLGRWMRDRWGLWTGGPLARHLRALGLDHPDDMSGVILTSLWRRLHFQPLRVAAQVRWYQAFRRAAQTPDPAANPGCGGRVEIAAWWTPEVSSESGGLAPVRRGSPPAPQPAPTLRIVHLGECSADGRLWAWEAGRGWFEPEAAQREYWERLRRSPAGGSGDGRSPIP